MGRKLDALLGRNFKTSKFRTLAKLAISRIAILKNQHQVRYSHARSDAVELLKLGHHERALHRVEYVIKEQNMLDVLVMMEDYCHMLIERVLIIQNNRECPDELKQAISSLIFASSRCGEFPELQKIREIFTLWFGKEFASRAVELRNNCGVNSKIINKLSSRQPSLESRLKVLGEISSEIGITLHLEEYAPAVVQDKPKVDDNQKQLIKSNESAISDDTNNFPEDLNLDGTLSESVKQRKKYRDVATAARDAFQSAAYAAAAARAAIELSRFDSQESDSDDEDDDGDHHQGNVADSDGSSTPILHSNKAELNGEDMAVNNSETNLQELEETARKEGQGKAISASESKIMEQITASDSDQDILIVRKQLSNFQSGNEQVSINQVALNDIRNDPGKINGSIQRKDLDTDRKPCLHTNEYQHDSEYNKADDQFPSDAERDDKLLQQSPKEAMARKTRLSTTQGLTFVEQLHSEHSSIDWKALSMRTRREQGI